MIHKSREKYLQIENSVHIIKFHLLTFNVYPNPSRLTILTIHIS